MSVVVTIVPHHQMRSWTSHLFGGVYFICRCGLAAQSAIAAVPREAISISERARPRRISVWTGKARQPPSSRRA